MRIYSYLFVSIWLEPGQPCFACLSDRMFCQNMSKTPQGLLKTTVSRSRVDNEVFTAKLKPTSKNSLNQRIYSYLFVSIFWGCVSIRIYSYLSVSIRIYSYLFWVRIYFYRYSYLFVSILGGRVSIRIYSYLFFKKIDTRIYSYLFCVAEHVENTRENERIYF